MKSVAIILLVCCLSFHFMARAELLSEVYPGKLVRRELTSETSDRFAKLEPIDPVGGHLAFLFRQFERRHYTERPFYEKVILRRETKNADDAGQQTVVPNEYLEGDLETREEINLIGPVVSEAVTFLGEREFTTENGVLIDRAEVILSQFEDFRNKSLKIEFKSGRFGTFTIDLTRDQLNEAFGIEYNIGKVSTPGDLRFEGTWSKATVRPRDITTLSIEVQNVGIEGVVYQVLARSVSRWDWLDGKMFYFGNLEAGEAKTFTRLFRIPAEIADGDYYLRVGIRDYSGAKQQLPLVLTVR